MKITISFKNEEAMQQIVIHNRNIVAAVASQLNHMHVQTEEFAEDNQEMKKL
jgi:K+/H+ antiporter YhaU regulatory subunit KhtT